MQRGIDSVEGRSFAEIALTDDDASRILGSGNAHLVEYLGNNQYRMRLLPDGTCSALHNGMCSIHARKPTLCRAFPFYIDMFVGLCAVTECPGFGAGWTPVRRLVSEVEAARQMYEFWLARIGGAENMTNREEPVE